MATQNALIDMKHLLFLLLFFVSLSVGFSQERDSFMIEKSEILPAISGTGRVKISQNILLRKLIKKHIDINNDTFDGWRVQIYFGSGKKAMTEAQDTKKEFLTRYGNKNGAYIVYDSPFFKVRVGDFRTKTEAMYFKSQIEKVFPESWVIPDRVYYPLESVE